MIALAKQEGKIVYVYDETGGILFNRDGELSGYTPNTVSIKRGSVIYVFDERGSIKFIK